MHRPLLALGGGALLALSLSLPALAQSPLCTPMAPPWASNNGGTAGGVVCYDLNITTAVLINSFDCNLSVANASVSLEIYTTPGTYVGSELIPGNWTLVASAGPVTSAAAINLPTTFTLASPLNLGTGNFGIGFRVIGSGQRYTGTGTGAQLVTSTSELTLTSGLAVSGLFTGSRFSFRNWNGCINYTPASGLFANFTATPRSGATPLNVQFTDTTFTSDPAGVQSWAWDLDGDSIVDSNAQNPRFTYSTCGYYNVALTVTDRRHPASSRTVAGFIQADPQLLVVPDFSFVGGGVPLSIAFTDTSIGNPTAWSWDFDGDNVPDSVQRNPTWAYSAGGAYTVTLTASNACGAGTVRKQVNVIGNDECVGAIPLTLGLSPVYTNQGATTSSGWPCALGGNDIWFSYRSTCNGSLEINTCTGSTYDTSLEAFSGTCSTLNSIVCNDDSCGLQSRIAFPVAPATTYYIRVGGYNSAQGSFQLNTILSSSGNGTFTNLFAACGGANLATTGAPNLGASISFTATPATGLPFIMIGSVPLGVPICPAGCMIGHNMDVVLPGASFQTNIPCWSFLIGGQVYFQAIELGTAGGCTVGSPAQLVTTNTVRATIG